MIIELTEFLNAVSRATDYVEAEVLDVPKHHVRRVAVLANRMAEYAGLDAETVYALTQAAMLHDCALPEYLSEESEHGDMMPEELNMAAHCVTGEEMMRKLPFYHLVEGAVLHHHDPGPELHQGHRVLRRLPRGGDHVDEVPVRGPRLLRKPPFRADHLPVFALPSPEGGFAHAVFLGDGLQLVALHHLADQVDLE